MGQHREMVGQIREIRHLKDRRMREPDFRWKNLGEAAISEFLADLDDHLPDNNPVLVLFDDLKAQKKQI